MDDIARQEGQRFGALALADVQHALIAGDEQLYQAKMSVLRGLLNGNGRRPRISAEFVAGVREAAGPEVDFLEQLDRIAS